MIPNTLLYLSNQPRVFKFVRNNRLAKHFARRFVAGETVTEALAVVRELNAKGITASLDLLGESVYTEREARAARDEYLQLLEKIRGSKLDANYIKCMRELMLKGNYPGIATHDPAMINEAKRWAKEQGITPDRFEFQMLYGIRRDLQESLVKEGYRVRCYVPFGTQWYPYLMRRLAERPANVAFITGNVIREALHGRK